MRVWTQVSFGKHEGATLPQIIFKDPDWFFWAMEKGALTKGGGMLAAEAREVDRKARNIRIPNPTNEPHVAEYVIHQPTGKFGKLDIVPSAQPLHQGGSPAFRQDRIDMSVPRSVSNYDKTGFKILVADLKHHLFGSAKVRLTKARVEEFFENDANFVG